MKKKSLLFGLILLLVCAAVLSFACAPKTEAPTEAPAETSADTDAFLPGLQPANHDGRFESSGADGCYECHGKGDLGNPNLADATAIPAFHYVDGDVESTQYSPDYAQCISCHPVGA